MRNLAAEQGIGFDEEGRRLSVPAVGDDGVARVQMNGVNSGLAESGGDDDAGKTFAEAQYRIGKSRRERTGFRNFAQDLFEFVEKRRRISRSSRIA